jgi:hypothetical protein
MIVAYGVVTYDVAGTKVKTAVGEFDVGDDTVALRVHKVMSSEHLRNAYIEYINAEYEEGFCNYAEEELGKLGKLAGQTFMYVQFRYNYVIIA